MKVQTCGFFVIVALLGGSVWANAQTSTKSTRSQAMSPRLLHRATGAALPFTDNRVHRIGNLWLNVTNYGVLAGLGDASRDPCTQLPPPALEFPGGTGTVNLWEGALWIGAVKGRDTLVSVASSVWPIQLNEMFPDSAPHGVIEERTTRPQLKPPQGSFCAEIPFHEEAVSEHDVIARYFDTTRSSQLVFNDPDDGRAHLPLGIEITQASYAWSLGYAQDFILVDYSLRNISGEYLRDVFVGLYVDQDLHHQSQGDGWLDDISGFLKTVPSPLGDGFFDTVNTAWSADNDGDPAGGVFSFNSNANITGFRLLKKPVPQAGVTFNWFVGNDASSVDWGPVRRASKVEFLRSGVGAPFGDRAKYQMMSNGEIDYDQVEAAINQEAAGWLPPDPIQAANIADGWDTRYLVATGPFDLSPDSSVSFTLAVVAGENFHQSPANFTTFWDPTSPEPFVERLDFTDFALNSRWADWVYDTPGFDTDGDGYEGEFRLINGERVYYRGDGVPDYSGPPAPPPPEDLTFETTTGKVAVRWNGQRSETTKDPFSNAQDFEGYRIYMSRTGLAFDFLLLAQRDKIDYTRYLWNATLGRWKTPDPPFTLDSLKLLYNDLTDSLYGRPFHPDDFSVPLVDSALRVIYLDPQNPSQLDTFYYYFGPFDANLIADDQGLAELADAGAEVLGTIRRVYPNAHPDSVAQREDGTWYAPYYEYEYALRGLQLAEPVFFAVTVFDFGFPGLGLGRLETSPLSNAEEVWPVNSAEVVKSQRPQPGVYPNPYRLVDTYNLNGWEDPRREGLDPERARKVTFTNVPDTCVVSIFSLDGDLVRRINHRENPSSSAASVVAWNLITRNTQAVKSGIYIWTIESRFGVDVGKLVIIK